MAETESTLSMATKIATSYVGNNSVTLDQVPALIIGLYEVLNKLSRIDDVKGRIADCEWN